ncbi:MAG: hypothetical protein R3F37_20330 [Candidatus Competibacteraceae bacterium]
MRDGQARLGHAVAAIPMQRDVAHHGLAADARLCIAGAARGRAQQLTLRAEIPGIPGVRYRIGNPDDLSMMVREGL